MCRQQCSLSNGRLPVLAICCFDALRMLVSFASGSMLSQGKGLEPLLGGGGCCDALSESESCDEHGNILFFVYLM